MQSTDEKYTSHKIFNELTYYAEFYQNLSDSVMCFPTIGTTAIMNMDTYVFMSMKGTIESISLVLKGGMLNDAYALLRKYLDSTMINAYTNQYINDHAEKAGFFIEEINDWLHGRKALPRMKKMSTYLNKSSKLYELDKLLDSDDRYKNLRKRCNDNMHYNYFTLLMLNEGKLYMKERLDHMDQLRYDIRNVFILHVAYLFIINEAYMMSSDYIDYLEMSMSPPDGSQYWVASFIKEMINSVLSESRPDIVAFLKKSTSMELV